MQAPSDKRDSSNSSPPSNSLTESILDYLEHHLPGYPFESKIDTDFVEELRADFCHVDLLEQIKIFRWYLVDHGLSLTNPRATLRRWIARARP